jgi:hypothetical protein
MKQRQLLPTVTVTVVPLATLGHKVRSKVIIIAAAIMRDEELFIGRPSQREDSNSLLGDTMLEK